jgi:hypothetical protein
MGGQQQQQQPQQWSTPANDFGADEWGAPRQQRQQQGRSNRSDRNDRSSFDERQQAWQADMGSARYGASLDNGDQQFAEAPGTSGTRSTGASDPLDAWVWSDPASSSKPPAPAQQQQQQAAAPQGGQEEPGDMLSSLEQGDDGTPLVRSTRSGRRRR